MSNLTTEMDLDTALAPKERDKIIRVALSIKQPWAWLIVQGHKDIENRSWPTKFRGDFLVHAGKSFDKEGYDYLSEFCPPRILELMPKPNEFEFGGIVGQARIVDCVEESESDWFFGDYGFVLRDAKPLPFRPLRGQLGFFKVGSE